MRKSICGQQYPENTRTVQRYGTEEGIKQRNYFNQAI